MANATELIEANLKAKHPEQYAQFEESFQRFMAQNPSLEPKVIALWFYAEGLTTMGKLFTQLQELIVVK
jgi:hypothetical protein